MGVHGSFRAVGGSLIGEGRQGLGEQGGWGRSQEARCISMVVDGLGQWGGGGCQGSKVRGRMHTLFTKRRGSVHTGNAL